MFRAKTDQFEPQTVTLAEISKALAHPARIAILKILARHKTCICGEIVQGLPLAQATVSQHLKELKRVGLIVGEVEGPKSCYCLNRERLNTYFELVTHLSKELNQESPHEFLSGD